MLEPAAPRVIFIGDSGVGKTSLIYRAKYKKFNDGTTPTIGAGITKMETVQNGVNIEYQLWDTAGQEIYRSVVPMYFKGVCGAVLVFSLEDRNSFVNLQSWIDELSKHTELPIPYVVVGNKIDSENQTVTRAEARKWASDRNSFIIFTSAFSSENVDILMEHIVSNFVYPPNFDEAFAKIQNKSEKSSCC
ncbi:Ras-related protein Rab-18 [Tritrichomonas foetus]|uniref:Ras-related protein Rab-18 n=1 Tax=Tritrichomonas foetus TaxID=1144522 RepID=A0A1J4L1R6_9EUKA|nr:Ras-related protein Rab-18 [Tritrichomonas foetus]|eukprot:OHT17463.1 Ras-related protein Rab-18 [Tritrichomonas foetus]